jgi:hypothetical protein
VLAGALALIALGMAWSFPPKEQVSRIPPQRRIREWNSMLLVGVLSHTEDVGMRVPKFGLSTIPVTQAKSALLLQIERDLLALVYRDPRG